MEIEEPCDVERVDSADPCGKPENLMGIEHYVALSTPFPSDAWAIKNDQEQIQNVVAQVPVARRYFRRAGNGMGWCKLLFVWRWTDIDMSRSVLIHDATEDPASARRDNIWHAEDLFDETPKKTMWQLCEEHWLVIETLYTYLQSTIERSWNCDAVWLLTRCRQSSF